MPNLILWWIFRALIFFWNVLLVCMFWYWFFFSTLIFFWGVECGGGFPTAGAATPSLPFFYFFLYSFFFTFREENEEEEDTGRRWERKAAGFAQRETPHTHTHTHTHTRVDTPDHTWPPLFGNHWLIMISCPFTCRCPSGSVPPSLLASFLIGVFSFFFGGGVLFGPSSRALWRISPPDFRDRNGILPSSFFFLSDRSVVVGTGRRPLGSFFGPSSLALFLRDLTWGIKTEPSFGSVFFGP